MSNISNQSLKSMVLVGGGNMGGSVIRGIIAKKLFEPAEVVVVDPNNSQLKLHPELQLVESPKDLIPKFASPEILFLAIKPQIAKEVCLSLADLDLKNSLVISCMAGIKINQIAEWLGEGASSIVRCMPNLPAEIGQSMTVYVTSEATSPSEQLLTKDLIESFGVALKLEDESMIDAATAVSGSGTGYIAYILGAWLDAAEDLGFSREQSLCLVQQTAQAGVSLWQSRGGHPKDLCQAVTSKGGTTEAALNVFNDGDLAKIFQRGIEAAFLRAKQLSELA